MILIFLGELFQIVIRSRVYFLTVELAMIMDRLYGGVCYAGIDTDPELKYPKGAGRVAFSNQQSYIAAISARFVQLQHNDIDKRVSSHSKWHCCGKAMKFVLCSPGQGSILRS